MQNEFKADASSKDENDNSREVNAVNEALGQIIKEAVFAGATIEETKAQIRAGVKADAEALRHLLNHTARAGMTISLFMFGIWIGWITGSHEHRIGLLEQNLVLVETHSRADGATRGSRGEPQAVGDNVTIR